VGDGFAPTRDRVPLAVVFHGVEEIGELAGRFGGGDFGQVIRSSDSPGCRCGVPDPAALIYAVGPNEVTTLPLQ
jgi:hypothetical protein